jgi:hypothetical protein
MRLAVAILVASMAGGVAGCRTVWVHPEASATKYRDDHYLCRYGEVRPTEEQLRQRALAQSQSREPEVIVPEEEPPLVSEDVNTGSGTNVNVNVVTAPLRPPRQPVVVPGHSPRSPSFVECMDVLGWHRERRPGRERWARDE